MKKKIQSNNNKINSGEDTRQYQMTCYTSNTYYSRTGKSTKLYFYRLTERRMALAHQ